MRIFSAGQWRHTIRPLPIEYTHILIEHLQNLIHYNLKDSTFSAQYMPCKNHVLYHDQSVRLGLCRQTVQYKLKYIPAVVGHERRGMFCAGGKNCPCASPSWICWYNWICQHNYFAEWHLLAEQPKASKRWKELNYTRPKLFSAHLQSQNTSTMVGQG